MEMVAEEEAQVAQEEEEDDDWEKECARLKEENTIWYTWPTVAIPGHRGATLEVTSVPGYDVNISIEDGIGICTTVEGLIAIDGQKVGKIQSVMVHRDRGMPLFWDLDAISDEFINGCLTFLKLDQRSSDYGEIQDEYKDTIPESCSFGPFLNLELVHIESEAHRGRDLGIDALQVYLDVLLREEEWTFIFSDIRGSGPTNDGLRRHFERLHFQHAARDNGDDGRYHWLAAESFHQGNFLPSPTTVKLKFEIIRLRDLVSRGRARYHHLPDDGLEPPPDWHGALRFLVEKKTSIFQHIMAFVSGK